MDILPSITSLSPQQRTSIRPNTFTQLSRPFHRNQQFQVTCVAGDITKLAPYDPSSYKEAPLYYAEHFQGINTSLWVYPFYSGGIRTLGEPPHLPKHIYASQFYHQRQRIETTKEWRSEWEGASPDSAMYQGMYDMFHTHRTLADERSIIQTQQGLHAQSCFWVNLNNSLCC